VLDLLEGGLTDLWLEATGSGGVACRACRAGRCGCEDYFEEAARIARGEIEKGDKIALSPLIKAFPSAAS
jgi:hypothetical protein